MCDTPAARAAGWRALACGLLVVWAAGCAPSSRGELAKEVLRADPSFAAVLEKRRELANRIETYQRELALKRRTVREEIAQLRAELSATAATVRRRIAELKSRMDPDRERLEQALAQSSQLLRSMQAQRAQVGRAVSQLKKSLATRQADAGTSGSAPQDQALVDAQQDLTRLDAELAAVREHLRLLQTKLLLIKW
jgi:chromosome segregation ATPase